MAHRAELLTQAADKLRMVTGLEASFEKAGVTSIGSASPITVGSVQSLTRPNRLERFPLNYYDVVIVDEAHHALSDTYMRWFQPAWDALSEDDQFVLDCFYNSNQYGSGAADVVADHYCVERASAHRKKARALDNLTTLLYGRW